jgi:hypothetical protein
MNYYHEDMFADTQECDSDPDTQDYLQGIVEAIYIDGNTKKLEHCLEELCHIHKVEYTLNELKIAKKPHPILEWYVDMQKQVIGE